MNDNQNNSIAVPNSGTIAEPLDSAITIQASHIMRNPFEDQVAELRSRGLVEKVDAKVELDRVRRVNEHMEMIDKRYSERATTSMSVRRLLNH